MKVCIEISQEELGDLKEAVEKRVLIIHAKLDIPRPAEWILARVLDAALAREPTG